MGKGALRHLPPRGGEHLPAGRLKKNERQPPWTAFWAFCRCANASKLSALGFKAFSVGAPCPGALAMDPAWGSAPDLRYQLPLWADW